MVRAETYDHMSRATVSFAHGYHGLNRAGWRLLRILGNIEIAEVFACLTPLNACNLSFRVQIGFIAKLKTPFKFSPDYPRARPGVAELGVTRRSRSDGRAKNQGKPIWPVSR